MTTTPLFAGLAQDTSIVALEALFQPNIQSLGFAGVGSTAQPDVTNKPIVTVQTSSYSGSSTLVPQGSNDNATWTTITAPDIIERLDAATGVLQSSITAAGLYRVNATGYAYFRMYQSSGTGSLNVAIASGPGVASVRLGSGGPVRIAAQAAGAADPGIQALGFRAPATPAARSAAGAYGAMMVDTEGKQVVTPHGDTAVQWQNTVAATTTATALKAAGATGIRNYATWVTIDNSSASAVRAGIYDGATMIWSGSCPANDSRHIVLPTPLKGTAATAMNATMLTGAAQVSVGGFQGV